MPQHWRATAFRPHGTGSLEIGEFQLWGGGVRLDSGVTVNVAPSTGSAANLSDDAAGTSATWTSALWPLLVIEADLGSDEDVDEIRIATGASKAVSLASFTLQASDDGGESYDTVELPDHIVGLINYVSAAAVVAITDSAGVTALPLSTYGVGSLYSRTGLAVAPGTLSTHLFRLSTVNSERFDGFGMVEGDLKIEANPDDDDVPDIPVRRLLRLHRESDGRMVKETFSNSADGTYAFTNISMDFRYYVIGFDNENHSYRAVIADNITPVPMP